MTVYVIIYLSREGQRKNKNMCVPSQDGRKEIIMTNEKFCVKCGSKFVAIGREVICPSCKAQAAEDAKRAAVLRAKRASWRGESVPVRISGRASTVIRSYAAANNMTFAESLDALLKASDYVKSTGRAWEDIVPYKSRRMKSSTDGEQDAEQDAPQEVKAAKVTSRASKSKATSKTSKTAGKAAK